VTGPLVEPKTNREFLDAMLEQQQAVRRKLRADLDAGSTRRPIHPGYVAATLDELAGPNVVFTADTGMSCVWAARFLSAAKGRRLLGSFVHGSMANALPQVIGAQAAMVQLEMEVAGMSPFGCNLKNPNFAALAQAVGLFGVRLEDPAELRPALKQALCISPDSARRRLFRTRCAPVFVSSHRDGRRPAAPLRRRARRTNTRR